MTTRKATKKNSLYAVALAAVLLATAFIYSCSNEGYDYANESPLEENGMARTRALNSRMMECETLLDSVAASDEFWEFEMSSKLLAEKFAAYTSTWSEEKFDELMYNVNDDDYMEKLKKEMNLEKELEQMAKAKENLLQNTGFLRLTDDERTELFMQFAENSMSAQTKTVKTRGEGGETDECSKQKKIAYTNAQADRDFKTSQCKCTGDIFTLCMCYLRVVAEYEKNLRRADRAYENCINSKK